MCIPRTGKPYLRLTMNRSTRTGSRPANHGSKGRGGISSSRTASTGRSKESNGIHSRGTRRSETDKRDSTKESSRSKTGKREKDNVRDSRQPGRSSEVKESDQRRETKVSQNSSRTSSQRQPEEKSTYRRGTSKPSSSSRKESNAVRSSSRRKEDYQDKKESSRKISSNLSPKDNQQTERKVSPSGRRLWDKENIATDLAEEMDQIAKKESREDEIAEEMDDYEEDFEDYDDDFEEDIDEEEEDNNDDQDANEEEVKLDSGHYDRKSAYQKARMEREMSDVKKAIVQENLERQHKQQTNRETSEPFEGSNETKPSSKRPKSSRGFINFSLAKEKQKTQIAVGKAAKRADRLLQMIRLDVVSFDLFELPPIRYEAFMKSFGTTNTMQATCQTGEDNLDEEVQTEDVERLDKWTQKPPSASAIKDAENDQELLTQAIKGVGGQMDSSKEVFVASDEDSWQFVARSDSMRLSKFLNAAGTALLTLLEESNADTDMDGQAPSEVEFSDKVTRLNTGLAFLKERPVTALAFAADQAVILLTAHGHTNVSEDTMSKISSKTFLCVWNVLHPSLPQKVLMAANEIHAVAFSPRKTTVAFGGQTDGILLAWDLREASSIHQEVTKEELDDENWVFRSPTYITEMNANGTHSSRITAVKSLPDIKEDLQIQGKTDQSINAFQLVSVEERGIVAIWTLLDAIQDFDKHIGLAHWGTVRLVQSMTIDLSTLSGNTAFEAQAFDITFNPIEANSLLLASDNGQVLHCSVHQHHRPTPRIFKHEYPTQASCTSVAFSPFGEEGHFLVGSDDGTIRLHSTSKERPLIVWPGSVDGQPIKKVIWSKSRPCVFCCLDTTSRIHLWDLGVGDIFPAFSAQLPGNVLAVDMNPGVQGQGTRKIPQLLAIGTHEGKIEVHQLLEEFRSPDESSCSKELQRFLHYVSIV